MQCLINEMSKTIKQRKKKLKSTSSPAVAERPCDASCLSVVERPCDASCLSVVSFNSTILPVQSSIISGTSATDLPLRKLNSVVLLGVFIDA